jgi:hypothetical protein
MWAGHVETRYEIVMANFSFENYYLRQKIYFLC